MLRSIFKYYECLCVCVCIYFPSYIRHQPSIPTVQNYPLSSCNDRLSNRPYWWVTGSTNFFRLHFVWSPPLTHGGNNKIISCVEEISFCRGESRSNKRHFSREWCHIHWQLPIGQRVISQGQFWLGNDGKSKPYFYHLIQSDNREVERKRIT